jgi:RNase P subunit RPR2
MRTEPVSIVPHCMECCAVWLPADEARWRAYWIDDGADEKLVFYCLECAEREFGTDE